jgi:hypothetical protein
MELLRTPHSRPGAALPELPLCTLCLSTGGINGCPAAEGYGRNHQLRSVWLANRARMRNTRKNGRSLFVRWVAAGTHVARLRIAI